ncbi:hypothetical protein M9H77_20872 [Catharanthus roseus]|uniref:Uncharacterized protein n=1 Tax=Catharanthus roseus TaxID=4058 RepID=A0ACC0ALV3_CATRO|nr:hypothetical protein M9H77_20872 [Catharanthus roseus]
MEAWPVGRSYGKLKLFFPSWLVKMKRQRASSGKDKRTGESCLAPLRMPTVYNWSWDELMDGYAMNAFQGLFWNIFRERDLIAEDYEKDIYLIDFTKVIVEDQVNSSTLVDTKSKQTL